MRHLTLCLLLFLTFGSLASLSAATKNFTIQCDHPNGVYAIGETVTWSISYKDPAGGTTPVSTFTVKKDGQDEVNKGKLDLSSGSTTITGTRAEPGALLLEIFGDDPKQPLPIAVAGAVFDPDKIQPAAPAPKDFNEFWKTKLEELAAVPIEPVEESAEAPNSDSVNYYKVTLNNIRGTKVHGQLGVPNKNRKYPALVVFQAAGVGPLDKKVVVNPAVRGWLTFNISAHDLPIDESDAFYKAQSEKWKTEQRNYIFIGNESRETSYFLRMILGCVRAIDYIATRPEWDRETIIVTGISQGGLQTLAAASLHPLVTGAMVDVPAGCDSYAPLAIPPRAFGWPYWLSNWGPRDRDPAKVKETAGYFDTINFAASVKCPTLIAVGLADNTSRPAGVIAAYNALQGPRELLIMPLSDHYGSEGTQADYFKRNIAWETAVLNKRKFPPAP
jgi:cephalosporin-C deacetylase